LAIDGMAGRVMDHHRKAGFDGRDGGRAPAARPVPGGQFASL
jgi:hypothetical protein